ncbi:hypothetical protein ABGB07_03915 [Micromonosporaceae bacterium B7E4]
MADKREFWFNFLSKETVSKTAGKAGDAVEDLGDKMSETQRDAKKLDDQIGEVEGSLKDLARQYAATGDDTFVKRIREQERELRKLRKVRTHLGDLIDPGDASDVAVSLGARIGPLFVQSVGQAVTKAGPGIAIGAPIVAGVATWLSSAGAGAVLGGAAAGAVAAGVQLAAGDSRVQAAGASLAESIGSQLEHAAEPFVPATLAGIRTVRAGFRDLDNEIQGTFAAAADYVQPFARALVGLGKEAAPSIERLVRSAGPTVAMLANELPELGSDIGAAIDSISDAAPGATKALSLLLDVAGASIRTVGGAVELAGKAFMYADIAAAAFRGGNAAAAKTAHEYAMAAAEADRESTDWAASLADLGSKAGGAATEIRTLHDTVNDIVDKNLSLAEANLRVADAVDAAKEAVDGKRKVTRAEEKSLTDLARSLNDATAQLDAQGVSAYQSAEAHEANRKKLIAAAIAAGHTRERAEELAAEWLQVPRNVTTTVKSKGIPEIKRDIAGIKGKTITIAMRLTGYTNISGTIAAIKKNQRWGGIDYAMASGGAIEAHHATSPTVLFGERQTGGEAFIPKNGNRQRSMQILDKAAGWYGAQVTPKGGARYAMAAHPGMTGGAVMSEASVSARPGAMQELVRLLMPYLRVEITSRYNGDLRRAWVTG